MKKSKILILLIVLIFVSCGRSAKSNENSSDLANDTLQVEQEMTDFQQYLSHFDTIKLPVSFDICSYKFETYVENSSFHTFEDNWTLAFGKIITDNYIATITLTIGDCFAPILTTYSYDGKVIDTKRIFITDMSDEGHISIANTLINKDFSILLTDTITNYETDTISGEDIDIEKYVLYQEGQITKSGKIKLSEEKKKIIQ